MKQMITTNKTARAITVIGYCLLVIVLSSCSDDGSQMRAQLEEQERQNRADSVMTNDSLAEHLVKYFDRHGTPNERMRAHYILGRTYADMGEAPAALEAYLDAADCANTTASDCDYRTLGCIYSQMGEIYHRQWLLSNEIEARRKSYQYASIAADTLGILTEMKLSASAFILLGEKKKAESNLESVLPLYDDYGFEQEGLQASILLMHLYAEDPMQVEKLGTLIKRYDAESDLFNTDQELPPAMRQYYYYKGRYFEGINQLDSAEYYYRKISHPEMPLISKVPFFKGLLSVYSKLHRSDSIAKYAELYCMANDSTLAISDREITSQFTSSYNYNRFQKEVIKGKAHVYRVSLVLLLTIITFLLVFLCCFFWLKQYLRRQKLKREKLAESVLLEQKKLHRLQMEKDELYKMQEKEKTELRNQFTQRQKELENQYLLEKEALLKIHQQELDELTLKDAIGDSLEQSRQYSETSIIRKIKMLKESPSGKLSPRDMKLLIETTKTYYPVFIHEILSMPNVKDIKICLLILTAQQVRPKDICRLLDSTPSVISNYRSEVNKYLFGEESATTLQSNLFKKYAIYPCLDTAEPQE